MAAIALVRKLERGQVLQSGARACEGELTLAEFQPQFERWGIRTEIREESL
jgi:hypothetical protein